MHPVRRVAPRSWISRHSSRTFPIRQTLPLLSPLSQSNSNLELLRCCPANSVGQPSGVDLWNDLPSVGPVRWILQSPGSLPFSFLSSSMLTQLVNESIESCACRPARKARSILAACNSLPVKCSRKWTFDRLFRRKFEKTGMNRTKRKLLCLVGGFAGFLFR